LSNEGIRVDTIRPGIFITPRINGAPVDETDVCLGRIRMGLR